MKKSGRPGKNEESRACKEAIFQAAVSLIEESGAGSVTVRKVIEKAGVSTGTFYHYFADKNDLMMAFVREDSFDGFLLETPMEDIAGRMTELYLHLIRKYQALGKTFMKSFYTTDNRALSAYMNEQDGVFIPGTVMARSETELKAAAEKGILKADTDLHQLAKDLCTMVKGCVFEWCLTEDGMDIGETLGRIFGRYFASLTAQDR